MSTPYFGEATCVAFKRDGTPCGGKAYFTKNATGECACGKHAKRGERTPLPKNPWRMMLTAKPEEWPWRRHKTFDF